MAAFIGVLNDIKKLVKEYEKKDKEFVELEEALDKAQEELEELQRELIGCNHCGCSMNHVVRPSKTKEIEEKEEEISTIENNIEDLTYWVEEGECSFAKIFDALIDGIGDVEVSLSALG